MLARRSATTGRASCRSSLYAAAIPLAFVRPWIADALYVAVALIWLVPDRRIERVLMREESAGGGTAA